VDPQQQVDVGAHHSDLENERPLLTRDASQESIEESSEPCVDERGATSCSPYYVHVEAVAHASNLFPKSGRLASFRRWQCRFHALVGAAGATKGRGSAPTRERVNCRVAADAEPRLSAAPAGPGARGP
jgi:hypothetical protein